MHETNFETVDELAEYYSNKYPNIKNFKKKIGDLANEDIESII